MTQDINREYFEWLCSLVKDSKPIKRYSYKKLMKYLYETEFLFMSCMDANRYDDGINLRYRFGYEHNIDDPIIASCLNEPCSILEMMVALSYRCEEHIMYDPRNGMLPGRWFWMMIRNLGLDGMHDSCFDEDEVFGVVHRFLYRQYSHDGKGNLIYIPNCQYDLRSMEIWYQMMRYLSEYRKNRLE